MQDNFFWMKPRSVCSETWDKGHLKILQYARYSQKHHRPIWCYEHYLRRWEKRVLQPVKKTRLLKIRLIVKNELHSMNKILLLLTLAPIWLPHCPAWRCTISLIFGLMVECFNEVKCLSFLRLRRGNRRRLLVHYHAPSPAMTRSGTRILLAVCCRKGSAQGTATTHDN